jgi:putative transposase
MNRPYANGDSHMNDPKTHHRRSIRLPHWDYSWGWWYYVTMCTKDRACVLSNIVNDNVVLTEIGTIVDFHWKEIPNHFPGVELDDYVIMPNHVHGIIIINDASVGAIHESPQRESFERNEPERESPQESQTIIQRRKMLLPKTVGLFKMNSAKQSNILRKSPGIAFWQRNYYDHIIRNDADLARIRTYIANNPLQWALDEENPVNVG